MAMRTAAVAVFALVLAAAAAEVRAGQAPGELHGKVFNATCPGPCQDPPPPLPLYQGEGLTVVIRRLPERELVARLFPKDGTFAIAVAPGLYRVRAFVGPRIRNGCWEGSIRRKLVEEGLVTKVRLKVINICVQ